MIQNLVILILLNSCSSFQAERVDKEKSDKKALKITDEWVAKDTTKVVQELINQLENHRGYRSYLIKRQGEQTRVFIGNIKNLTAEPYFPINDINDELLYKLSLSGDFVLVDATSRDALLKEITYQNDGMVDGRTAQQIGKQTGANTMIFGNVYMKPARRDGKTIKEYAINLRITDVEKGIEVARLRTRLYKYSEQSSSGW